MSKKTRRFWNFSKTKDGKRILHIKGEIAHEQWFGEETTTPKQFIRELNACDGDVEVQINSPGGSVFAAAEIHGALKEYPGKVTARIDPLAASAASVIAMAAEHVSMTPTAMMMIHNPLSVAWGEEDDMKRAAAMLAELKESIINAYQIKTGLGRVMLSNLMDDETWMNARRAVRLGFADEVLYTEQEDAQATSGYQFSRARSLAITNAATAAMIEKIKAEQRQGEVGPEGDVGPTGAPGPPGRLYPPDCIGVSAPPGLPGPCSRCTDWTPENPNCRCSTRPPPPATNSIPAEPLYMRLELFSKTL